MRWFLLIITLGGCFYDEVSPIPADFGTCTVSESGTAEEVGAPAPTWFRDVEPIVVAKCQGCHTDGGIAPFALDRNAAIAMRAEIADAVSTQRMPPWQPAACCNHYLRDRSLTDAERETVLRWIGSGQPDGDPADAHAAPPPALGLPRADLHAEMHVPFAPKPVLGNNELRCFLLDHAPIEHTTYVTGFEFHPGVRAQVHHAIASAVPADIAERLAARDGADGRPGWDCRGEGLELQGDRYYLGGWQPGDLARILPADTGRELPAGSRVYLQIHYDAGHGEEPDLSSFDVMLADRVSRTEKAVPVGNPLWFIGDGLEIDPHAEDASVWFAYDPTILSAGRTIEITNVMLHMHEFGSHGRVAVLRADGTTDCVLNIPSWDFHWLSDYDFAEPVRVNKGDRVYVDCHWTNPTDRTLWWGTDQEMCGAVLTYSEEVKP